MADLFADGYRTELLAGVVDLGEAWYLHDRAAGALITEAGLEPVDAEASDEAGHRLLTHPGLFEDLTPMLAELASPACLIVGEADLVTAPRQVEAFARVFGSDQTTRVEKAGHFVQAEQPDTYTRLVLDFVVSPQGTLARPPESREGAGAS
jgi:pimeloyl-ACP methyl ester carboxylesterase